MPMKYVAQTKYPNKCAQCGKTIPAGSEAYWNGEKGKASINWHTQCNPHHNQASSEGEVRNGTTQYPKTAQSEGKGEPNSTIQSLSSSGSPISAQEDVSKRLDVAVSIMCKKFNLKSEEINPDSMVLYEILHQLISQRWLEKEMR